MNFLLLQAIVNELEEAGWVGGETGPEELTLEDLQVLSDSIKVHGFVTIGVLDAFPAYLGYPSIFNITNSSQSQKRVFPKTYQISSTSGDSPKTRGN